MNFIVKEARALLEMFVQDPENPDEVVMVSEVASDEIGHSGPGLYAYYEECPKEGAIYLPDSDLGSRTRGLY